MAGSRLYLMGIGGALALAAGSTPLHALRPFAPCPLAIAPVQATDSRVADLGREFVPPGHAHPANPPTGGMITEITAIYNHTRCTITVSKVDNFALTPKDQQVIVEAGQSVAQGRWVRWPGMWVPWADHWNSPQRLQIRVGTEIYYEIWQKGDRLAFRTVDQYSRQTDAERRDLYDSALSVPGVAASGGQRHLHIAVTDTGELYFRFDGVPQ